MSELIYLEVNFFITSAIWGVILLILYDGLRIVRRLWKHSILFISIEDILFWIISGLLIFRMMYEKNNGTIRGFSIMAMGIGMMAYHYLISELVVESIVRLLQLLFSPFLWVVGKIKRCICNIIVVIKKIIKFLVNRLIKIRKTVKIALTKK